MAYSYQGIERANLELYGSYLGVEFMSVAGPILNHCEYPQAVDMTSPWPLLAPDAS